MYLFIWERTSARIRGEGEEERESQVDSPLSAESNTGKDFMTQRSRPELKPRVGCLTDLAIQAPPRTLIALTDMLLSYVFALRTTAKRCLEKYIEELGLMDLEPDYLSSNLDSTTYFFVELGPLVSSFLK